MNKLHTWWPILGSAVIAIVIVTASQFSAKRADILSPLQTASSISPFDTSNSPPTNAHFELTEGGYLQKCDGDGQCEPFTASTERNCGNGEPLCQEGKLICEQIEGFPYFERGILYVNGTQPGMWWIVDAKTGKFLGTTRNPQEPYHPDICSWAGRTPTSPIDTCGCTLRT